MMKNLKKTVYFLIQHPIGKKNKVKTLTRFFIWQLTARFFPKGLIKSWVEESKIFVKKSLHSATANYYVGLQEFEEMSFALHVLENDDLFFDVGSNIGIYTILASKIKKAKTFAFEPVKETIKTLEKNISLNNIESNVSIFSCALGDTTEISYMTNNQDSENHVIVKPDNLSQPINVNRLDDLVAEVPILIKIDTEGYEFKILKGAKKIIENDAQKAIILEMNGASLRYGDKDSDVHDLLTEHGYKLYSYHPFERKLYLSNSFKSGNNIYIKDIDYISNRIIKSRSINVYGNKL